MADARTVLEEIVEKDILNVPDCPAAPVTAYLDANMVRRRGSQDRRLPLNCAAYEFHFQPVGPGRVNASNKPVCAAGLPLYPYAHVAIEHQLGVRIVNPGTPEVVALAPDYRARVKRVRLSTKGAAVEIEAAGSDDANILGKVYHENAHGRTHADLSFQNGLASFEASGYPRKMMVVLLARDRGDQIDEWYYDADQALHGFGIPSYSGVEIDESEENLENLIQGGESETLEFKRELPGKQDLAATITAFANTDGGRLLIGVTDKAEITGCALDKIPDTLTNIVRAHCEPEPSFTTTAMPIRDTTIVIVNVAAGSDKPYMVKDHGSYVRVGATTRRANRYEMDQLYATGRNQRWS